MIVAIVSFKLPKRWNVSQATEAFASTAPKYQGKPGLIRKHYYLSEAGERAGGIYLWETRAAAEGCYTREWKETVAGEYGAPSDILYAEVPVTVDNVSRVIEA
jgi:hypothetical protein